MSVNNLRMMEPSPGLSDGGHVTFLAATALTGIDKGTLLRAAATGELALYVRVVPAAPLSDQCHRAQAAAARHDAFR